MFNANRVELKCEICGKRKILATKQITRTQACEAQLALTDRKLDGTEVHM